MTGLDVREISYLIANAKPIKDLKFSSLPTQPSDDSPANAATLFSQFLTLADYANLREGPAGGTRRSDRRFPGGVASRAARTQHAMDDSGESHSA